MDGWLFAMEAGHVYGFLSMKRLFQNKTASNQATSYENNLRSCAIVNIRNFLNLSENEIDAWKLLETWKYTSKLNQTIAKIDQKLIGLLQ